MSIASSTDWFISALWYADLGPHGAPVQEGDPFKPIELYKHLEISLPKYQSNRNYRQPYLSVIQICISQAPFSCSLPPSFLPPMLWTCLSSFHSSFDPKHSLHCPTSIPYRAKPLLSISENDSRRRREALPEPAGCNGGSFQATTSATAAAECASSGCQTCQAPFANGGY